MRADRNFSLFERSESISRARGKPAAVWFRRLLMAATIVIVCALLQGCVYLHRTTDSDCYCGWVLDQQAETPIHKARVELLGRNHTAASKTRTNGWFSVGPLKSSHVGVAVPPAERPLIGEAEYSRPLWLTLTVSKSGYETKEIPIQVGILRSSGGMVNLGNIYLPWRQKEGIEVSK